MTRPAHRIRLFVSRIVSTGTMERLVDPILGDIETVCYAATFFEMSEIARIVPPTVAAWLPTLGLAVTSVVLLRARPLTPSNP